MFQAPAKGTREVHGGRHVNRQIEKKVCQKSAGGRNFTVLRLLVPIKIPLNEATAGLASGKTFPHSDPKGPWAAQ